MNLPKDIPEGIRITVERLAEAITTGRFGIAKVSDESGEEGFLLCSFEALGKGEAPVMRQLCELVNALDLGEAEPTTLKRDKQRSDNQWSNLKPTKPQ